MKKEKIIEMISGMFILLWLYAAITKLAEFGSFLKGLQHFPVIGWAAWPIAIAIPLLEIGLSLLLFFPATRKKGMNLSLYLMSLFTVYIGWMIVFAPDKPCGCGGVLQSLSWTGHLLFNLAFIVLAVTGIRLYKNNEINTGRIQMAH